MATSTTETVKRMLRKRGALVAAVTAGGVGVWLVVQSLLQQLFSVIAYAAYSQLDQIGTYFWPSVAEQVFLFALPVGLGFFLSLWLVAPISELLALGHVITRSVLAVGIASTVFFIVRVVFDVVRSIAFDRPLFSNSFPELQFDGPGIVAILASDLQTALSNFVGLLPLGVLAGILLWHWRKANPPKFHVEGLIDV